MNKKPVGRPRKEVVPRFKDAPEEFVPTPEAERRRILESKPYWDTYSRAEAIDAAKKILARFNWKWPQAWLNDALSERPPMWFTMGEMERARTRGGKSVLRPIIRFFEEDLIRYYIQCPPSRRGGSRVPSGRILYPKGV